MTEVMKKKVEATILIQRWFRKYSNMIRMRRATLVQKENALDTRRLAREVEQLAREEIEDEREQEMEKRRLEELRANEEAEIIKKIDFNDPRKRYSVMLDPSIKALLHGRNSQPLVPIWAKETKAWESKTTKESQEKADESHFRLGLKTPQKRSSVRSITSDRKSRSGSFRKPADTDDEKYVELKGYKADRRMTEIVPIWARETLASSKKRNTEIISSGSISAFASPDVTEVKKATKRRESEKYIRTAKEEEEEKYRRETPEISQFKSKASDQHVVVTKLEPTSTINYGNLVDSTIFKNQRIAETKIQPTISEKEGLGKSPQKSRTKSVIALSSEKREPIKEETESEESQNKSGEETGEPKMGNKFADDEPTKVSDKPEASRFPLGEEQQPHQDITIESPSKTVHEKPISGVAAEDDSFDKKRIFPINQSQMLEERPSETRKETDQSVSMIDTSKIMHVPERQALFTQESTDPKISQSAKTLQHELSMRSDNYDLQQGEREGENLAEQASRMFFFYY